MNRTATKELTGRHVAIIFAICFGVTLIANITMLTQAVRTFSGLVVPNSYVASQDFDKKRSAQEALNWVAGVNYSGETFKLWIRNEGGSIVEAQKIHVTVGRPTSEREDQEIDLAFGPDGYNGTVELKPGRWRAEVDAQDPEGTKFQQRLNFVVPGPE